jgi:hypothetical protein
MFVFALASSHKSVFWTPPKDLCDPVDLKGLSCSPVLEENLFDICRSEFGCPGQGSGPRFVIRQVGRGTAVERELDHPSPALRQLGLIFSSALTEQGDSRYPRGATSQLKAR